MLFHCTSVDSYLSQSSDLKAAVRKLEINFAGLLCFAVDALKHAGVSSSKVRIFLNNNSVSQKENFPFHRMPEIISYVTLEEIFIFCSRIEIWNFLNFQILMDLADQFEVDGLQSRLREHSAAVSIFKRNTKLVDFLHIWAGRNSLPNSEDVFAMLKVFKWEDYTLEDVARHEKYLASEFQLRQLVVRFIDSGKGSVPVAAERKIMSGKEMPAFDGMTISVITVVMIYSYPKSTCTSHLLNLTTSMLSNSE